MACDRAASREARKAVRELLLDRGVAISPSCPLHPDNDRLLPHESRKKMLSRAQWQCSECGKLFRSERHLDLHLERKHEALLMPNATVCLGEYCDMLRCPSWLEALRAHSGACDEGRLAGRRLLCQHLLHDCVAPPHPHPHPHPRPEGKGGVGSDHLAFERLEQRLCQPLSCAALALLKPGPGTPPPPAGAPAAWATPTPRSGVTPLPRSGVTPLPGVAGAPRALAAHDEHGALYYAFAVALLLGLASFYAYFFWQRAARRGGSGDLRARRSRRGGPWQWLRPKHKAY